MALIGCGKLRRENYLNQALDSGYAEFIAVGTVSIINRDFFLLLKESFNVEKENKGVKIELEIDPEHPEKYGMSSALWKLCVVERLIK